MGARDASEGTALDPLANKSFDLNAPQKVPSGAAPAQPVQPAPAQAYQPTPVAPATLQPGMVQLTAEQYAAMQAGMVAQVAPAPPESQSASYADYAARMGFTPTEQGHPAPVTDTPPF